MEDTLRRTLYSILLRERGSNPQEITFSSSISREGAIIIEAKNLYSKLILDHSLIVPYVLVEGKTSWYDDYTQITYRYLGRS